MCNCIHKCDSKYIGQIYCSAFDKDKHMCDCTPYCCEYESKKLWLVLTVEHSDDLENPPRCLTSANSYDEAFRLATEYLKEFSHEHPSSEIDYDNLIATDYDDKYDTSYSYVLNIVSIEMK